MAYLNGLGDLGRWEFDEDTGRFHWAPQQYEGWFTRTFGRFYQGYPSAYYQPSQWFYRQQTPQVRARPAVQRQGECISYDYYGRCRQYMPLD